MTDLKKLSQQKTELKELWEFLELKFPLPTQQLPLWLLEYGKELIEQAFQTLAKKADTVDDPVKYLAGVMRNCKERSMTPEQRETQISTMRAAAARVKAQKAHAAKIRAEKDAFAVVLQSDAEVCSDLQTFDGRVCVGVGEGVGGPVCKGVGEGQKPTELRSVSPNLNEKQEQAPNQNPNLPQEQPRKVCKRCGEALLKSVNHVCGGLSVAPNQEQSQKQPRRVTFQTFAEVEEASDKINLRSLGVAEL